MKYTVLLTAPYMIPVLDRFRPVFEKYDIELLVPDVNERMEEADLLHYAGQFDSSICGDDRFTARARSVRTAPQSHFQVGDGRRLDRRRSLLPLWDQALPHPERVHPPRRGLDLELHPGVRALPALDGQGNEKWKVGEDPREEPERSLAIWHRRTAAAASSAQASA
jgi:hypothetical protein